MLSVERLVLRVEGCVLRVEDPDFRFPVSWFQGLRILDSEVQGFKDSGVRGFRAQGSGFIPSHDAVGCKDSSLANFERLPG